MYTCKNNLIPMLYCRKIIKKEENLSKMFILNFLLQEGTCNTTIVSYSVFYC